jgi:hypothetical protein
MVAVMLAMEPDATKDSMRDQPIGRLGPEKNRLCRSLALSFIVNYALAVDSGYTLR